jgi:hypothetical protein
MERETAVRTALQHLVWVCLAVSLACGCVEDTNAFPDTKPFPGNFLRSYLCRPTDDAVNDVAKSFIGCIELSPVESIAEPAAMGGVITSSPMDDGSVPVPAGSGGPSGAPVASGAGGVGASPMPGGSGGASASAPTCPGKTCSAPAGAQSCCLDAAAGVCGMQSGGSCVALPSTEPCPGVDLTRQGYGMLMPCCTAGQCGVNTQRIPGGMPCTGLAEARRTAEMMGYRDIVPAARACPAP